ncbi:MAG: hypothetical protein ABJD24_13980 [Acidimicrobiales bacterium]
MLGQVNAVGKRRCPWAAVALVAVIITAACGSSEPAAQGTAVKVVESDFEIKVQTNVTAGDVVLMVHNQGPDDHELIVVPAPVGELPMRGSGLTVAEESFKPEPLGVLEPGAPGSDRRLQLHLQPGRYVLFCNMSGHYLGGMHETLVAS